MEKNNLLSEALRGIHETLAADGFELTAKEKTDGIIDIIIHAGPEACKECLVPESILEHMIINELQEHGFSFSKLDLHLPEKLRDGSFASKKNKATEHENSIALLAAMFSLAIPRQCRHICCLISISTGKKLYGVLSQSAASLMWRGLFLHPIIDFQSYTWPQLLR